jgi:hypothetical protein
MLDATGLHFVRCIKPNAALSPNKLATDLVLQQLRCCGVLEVARVSRAGFPTRYRSGLQGKRHSCCAAHVLVDMRGVQAGGCRQFVALKDESCSIRYAMQREKCSMQHSASGTICIVPWMEGVGGALLCVLLILLLLLAACALPRHIDFVERYKILLPHDQQGKVLSGGSQAQAAVLNLLTIFKVPQGQFEMGRTKVFFKPGTALLLLAASLSWTGHFLTGVGRSSPVKCALLLSRASMSALPATSCLPSCVLSLGKSNKIILI